MSEELNFEKAMARLGEITEVLNKNECSLDEGIKLFEEALELSNFCSAKLKECEARVNQLTEKMEKSE